MSDDADHDKLLAEMDAMMADFENNQTIGLFVENQTVEARYHDGDIYYKGRIANCNDDGTFDVKYMDGEVETNKSAEDVRAVEQPSQHAVAVAVADTVSATIEQPTKVSSPNATISHEHEKELNIMSEDEMRGLSRNTTEDRNISHTFDEITPDIATSKYSQKPSTSNKNDDTFNATTTLVSNTYGDTDELLLMERTMNDRAYSQLGDGDDDLMGNFDNYDDIIGVENENKDDADMYSEDEDYNNTAGRPGTAESSDFNRDGSLKRKPYQSKLSKPLIIAGNTTISLSQAKLFGIIDSHGKKTTRSRPPKEIDPDVAIKNTLNRIDKLTDAKKKDLSYIQTEDDIELNYKTGTSAKARAAMAQCGYDFIDDPKPKDTVDVMVKIAEEDYIDVVDKFKILETELKD